MNRQSDLRASHYCPHRSGMQGIKPAPLSLEEGLKQNTLTVQSHRHFSNRNNGKHVDRKSNGIITYQKIMNEQEKFEHRLYIYTSSLMK